LLWYLTTVSHTHVVTSSLAVKQPSWVWATTIMCVTVQMQFQVQAIEKNLLNEEHSNHFAYKSSSFKEVWNGHNLISSLMLCLNSCIWAKFKEVQHEIICQGYVWHWPCNTLIKQTSLPFTNHLYTYISVSCGQHSFE